MHTQEKLILSRYASIADAIAILLNGYAEIVIHSLQTCKVLYIANNLSNREIGCDSGLDEINFNGDETVIGPYNKLNWDGKNMRAISVILGDDKNSPDAMMCINMNLAEFEAARDVLNLFLNNRALVPQPEKLFHDDWQERVNTYIHNWLAEQQRTLIGLSRQEKKALVFALHDHGAFKGKYITTYVAKTLQLSRTTVFNYLKQVRS
ncbi:PAS domain-containing protein [Shewanella sp. VB17]|uniref:helix-turn-helix transcriptional regulator n=1 Tax=Shewanella sp. VB17 TaxID=2739432 RepID=UPI001566CCE9|nr:PAS domain-containing protein [Shewanella sp. VB17]NRD74931.1 PAS domain-containing protein [Shewanella sp. VB17]